MTGGLFALLALGSVVGFQAPSSADSSSGPGGVPGDCPTSDLAGLPVDGLTNDLFFFADGSRDANWQAASPGYVGDVTVDGESAHLRTSGHVPYAGTVSTNADSLGAWQGIVDDNPGQASAQTGQDALVASRHAELDAAFQAVNGLPVTYANRSSSSLDGLNTENGSAEVVVINVTSGFQVTDKLDITGDADDVFVLRWDTDANSANGYQGQVKFQSGGAIVPHGGLTPGNFVHVAGDIKSSGGGSRPASPYPQGPRLADGQGSLINGGKDFNGGGFFTGFWLTTGSPTNPADATHAMPYGASSSLSNGIFVGGWYSYATQFSMTSGTAGVHVCPNPETDGGSDRYIQPE